MGSVQQPQKNVGKCAFQQIASCLRITGNATMNAFTSSINVTENAFQDMNHVENTSVSKRKIKKTTLVVVMNASSEVNGPCITTNLAEENAFQGKTENELRNQSLMIQIEFQQFL